MGNSIISLYIKALTTFEQEQDILDFLQNKPKINKVTVNLFDRLVLVSGEEVNEQEVKKLLKEAGYVATNG